MLLYNVLNSWVEKMMKKDLPVKIKTSNITSLSTKDINKLKAGDIVLKKTGNQKHAYIVSYKEDNQGICLTYNDALYTETVSYEYNTTTKTWDYNSTDKTVIQKELTAGDNIAITDAGVVSTTYTAGSGINITDGVISSTASNAIYEHSISLNFYDQSNSYSCTAYISIVNSSSTPYTLATFKQYLQGLGEYKYLVANGMFKGTNTQGNTDAGIILDIMYIDDDTKNNLQFNYVSVIQSSVSDVSIKNATTTRSYNLYDQVELV